MQELEDKHRKAGERAAVEQLLTALVKCGGKVRAAAEVVGVSPNPGDVYKWARHRGIDLAKARALVMLGEKDVAVIARKAKTE